MPASSAWFVDLVEDISGTTPNDQQTLDDLLKYLSPRMPDSFTITELLSGVNETLSASSGSKTTPRYQVVLGILAALRRPQALPGQPPTGDLNSELKATEELATILAKWIAPVEDHGNIGTADDGDADMISEEDEHTKKQKQYNDLVQRCRSLAGPAISSIHELITVLANARTNHLDEVLITLIAYASASQNETPSGGDQEDAGNWTTPEISTLAETALLDEKILPPGAARDQFIINGILERYLRPLFSKTKRPAAVTASGRKAAYANEDDEIGLPDDSWVTKPWKFTDHRAVPVFAWAVNEADEQLITKHWPLFIPVLLTLVDDPTTRIRARGLKVLSIFLAKFPSKLLHDTGLSQVFEDAVFPTLSYLPSLTPEKESVQLLVPAFEVLRILARKQGPPLSTISTTSSKTTTSKNATFGGSKEKENKLLDRILREGVFTAYFHAKEHMRIVEVLCQETVLVLQHMGIHAVKHLKVSYANAMPENK